MNSRLLSLAVSTILLATACAADDPKSPTAGKTVEANGPAYWPQWEGPDRTNVSRETGLLQTWPKGGPKVLWTFDKAGIGYSGPAIVGERLYTMGARAGKEVVYCLDAAKGEEVWATEIGRQFDNRWGDGPRGTPTVDGDFVYGIGGQGDVFCVKAAKGEKVWQQNMQKDFGGDMMSGWGYSESPLLDGKHLICTPGGKKGTLAALDKATGAVVSRSTDVTDPAAYSSPIVAEVGSVRQYVQMTGKGIVGVAAKDGKQLWHYPRPEYRTAVIPTPIFRDGLVYVTADYGAGCDLLRLSPDGEGTKMEKVYSNKVMQNHHGGVVLIGDHIYGCSGNSNSRIKWVCQELKTGNAVWEEEDRKFEAGALTCAGGRLYLYGQTSGTVVLLEPSPAGWKEHGRLTIPRQTAVPRKSGKIWTHPVVANGRLYLRDQDLFFCYDVRAAGR